jgi:serine/threonine protein kinase
MSDDAEIVDAGEESLTDFEPVRAGTLKVSPLTRGMVLGGRYEILKVIGRGGMGVVVRANDRTLHEEVAIKIVRAEFAGDPFWADRLAREVKLARQIQHPNVCRVFDFESAEGRVFLVMELATTRTLRSEIAAGQVKTRPLADRLSDARAVASGLGAIHAAGIVHRDLSAQNLLRMSDGRLVLSDFGLATDSFDNSNAVQGGTLAYMAPELARGGRASFASDVWALGVVVHEAVFGRRPSWRTGSFEMSDPGLGRRLAPEERRVLEICRRCVAPDPARRPARAGTVSAQLSAGRRSWRPTRLGLGRRLAPGISVVLAMIAVGVLGHRIRPSGAGTAPLGPPASSGVSSPPAVTSVVPTGQARDWSATSKVLAELEQEVRCVRVLPDRRTARFVWGSPPRAEDLDVETGRRRPSPIVPASYAEGCPDLSPDGRRMVYAGHTADGRAFAFVSERTDGGNGVPVVATSEPSQVSEPTWLADNQTFSYDVDFRHMGIYSLTTKRSTVLPEPTTAPHPSAFRYVSGDRIFVSAWLDASSTEISGYSVPSLREEHRLHLSEYLTDWRATDNASAFYTTTNNVAPSVVFAIDLARNRSRRAGFIAGQFVDRLAPIGSGLLVVSARVTSTVTVRWQDGQQTDLRRDWLVFGGDRCGRDLLLSEKSGDGIAIVRVDPHGAALARMSPGPADLQVTCAPDGRSWFYSSFGPGLGLWRCEGESCRRLVGEATWGSAVSPDGERVAFATVTARGPAVRWVPTGGGEARDLADTETICGPAWSSPRTLWIARRRGSHVVWTEVDADSARPTGRTRPGTSDCTDARNDPETPDTPVRIRVERHSQIRLVPETVL